MARCLYGALPALFALAMLPSGAPASAQGAGVYWQAGAGGGAAHGLKILSGGDGIWRATSAGGAPAVAIVKPGSNYLYFALDPAREKPSAPVYVSVLYFDAGVSGGLILEYDSTAGDRLVDRYRPAEDAVGGGMLGTGKWRAARFRLSRPLFQHRQNNGADLRLTASGPLTIASVRIGGNRPADWDAVARESRANVKALVHIGPGGEFIVGGFDPPSKEGAAGAVHALEQALPALKSLGVTSHEGYVRWGLCEPQEGRFDWSVYDPFVRVYKRAGLKWVPFIILGSAYSLPDWYFKKPGSQGYVCLEHNQETHVQSLWNPDLRKRVARFLAAFCDHYRDSGVIESILLGITGNYGEAIYPVTGNDWTADVHGPYHTHPGYWCGDHFAADSFKAWLVRRYGGGGPLRDAWGDSIGSIEDAHPFLRANAPNDRAWLDMVSWYIDSMTQWARFWLKTTREHFPQGEIYLCTGGDAPPWHGSDFGAQCKAAAEVHGGVRITNESSDYAANWSLTRWVASAGKQYGAYYSFEPAGNVDPNGVIARIYGATSSGAHGLHYYYPNLFDTAAARDNFVKWGRAFKQRKPVVEIAVYYPETWIKLHGQVPLGSYQPLRDRFDFDYMSDGMILDGGLGHIKALILMGGDVSERKVWDAIGTWVKRGGLLLAANGMGTLRTPEGDAAPNEELLGAGVDHGAGRVALFNGGPYAREYRDFLASELGHAPELSVETRRMVTADGKEDGCYVTLCAPNELLWLNATDHPVAKNGVTIQAHSISSQRIRAMAP
jgi:hypothetical protein